MTNIHITEADVGKKFRLRNGGEVTVIGFDSNHTYSVKARHIYFPRSWTPAGIYVTNGLGPLDIVERLPEEGEPSFKGKAPELVVLNELDAPTMTASDGKQYPMELFGVQQRFSDRTPPEGVDLCVDVGAEEFMQRVKFQWREGQIYVYSGTPSERSLTYGEVEKIRWTIAPTPAVEKVEPQIWDEYVSASGDFVTGKSPVITLWGIKNMPEVYKALAAYIQHILSQNKGES